MNDYLLGMDPIEVRRLENQHLVWRAQTERVWELAAFGTGHTVVDLGCGPGLTSIDLARVVGRTGRVIAVDSSRAATARLEALIRQKRIRNITVVHDEVGAFDPSPWKPDGLFARWLFCFVRRPELVLSRLGSGLTAGTRVAVMDYWNYRAIRTEPEAPLFSKVFRAVYDSFADAGGSLDIAGHLPAFFRSAGLKTTYTEAICRAGRPMSDVWNWLTEFQRLYLPSLVEKGHLTNQELKSHEQWWNEQGQNEDALLFAPPILGVVGVKP